jgi:hypothetical protein
MCGAGDHSGFESAERGNRYARRPIDRGAPDLETSLQVDPHAPRAARYHVAQVDRPSPDLRDAVILLTSELVTRAAQYSRAGCDEAVELSVWMPADVVRVELRAPRELLLPPVEHEGPHYDLLLLDQVADRWSIEPTEALACAWFEIDRQSREVEPEQEPQRQPRPRRRSLARRPHSRTTH